MKKRVMLILSCLLLSVGLITAQTTKITGTVVDNNGEPVISASVVVKGTTTGVVTDLDGNFSINVPKEGSTLVFSLIGMKTTEATASPRMKVTLETDDHQLEDVVVTALGIKRSEKAIGFAATSVKGEDISKSRTSDVMSSLAGKVAGVQISASSGSPGASNGVVIRGFSSLSGSNQPLYVVDGTPIVNRSTSSSDGLNSSYDFGNGASVVNPDDVESMTILKGAAATALYGSRAANGVIIITTKSGKKQTGYGIEYNGGLQLSTISKLPEFQNEFGMGWSGAFTMNENGSWGPRFDGSIQRWGNVYDHSQKMKPYSALKNNIRDFFDTGVRYSNSVSYSGADEKNEFFASFSQISDDGMLPTDADTYNKYTFSLRAGHNVGKFKVTESVNYSTQKNRFAPTGQGTTMINSLYQSPRDVSIIGLKDLNDPFNTPGYYYTPYGVMNPYYLLENIDNTFLADKLYGKIDVSYDFLNDFNFVYRLGFDISNNEFKLGFPAVRLDATEPNFGTFSDQEGSAEKRMIREKELNHDFMLTYNKTINDFNLVAIGGLNLNDRRYSRLYTTVTGLDIPTWYNISNSPATPDSREFEQLRRLVGLYGQAELGYKNMAYLTLTARNDWSSTLPKKNRSFFYPGVTGSFVFSELIKDQSLKDIISFGKARIAWGQTGNDADPYSIDPTFLKTSANLGFGSLTFPLKGTNAFTEYNILNNKELQPEITTEFELGANVGFFNNRISIDAAYYNRNSDKQIFDLDTDPASGYSSRYVNLGKIQNKGIELLVNVRPIEIKDFSWDVSWNFTKNNSKVISLPEELGGEANLYGLSGGIGMYAIVGEPVGVYKSYTTVKDPNGNVVVDANGLPILNKDKQEVIGDINYDYEMGFSTTLTYKGFSLRGDLDIRQGGMMYSRTKSINYFTGNAIQTTYNDRNSFIVPGSVQGIKNKDGVYTSYVENTIPISSTNIYKYWDNGGVDGEASNLIDKSYIKLRSVVFGWDIPRNWLQKTKLIQNATISVYGNNLYVWTAEGNTFIDPEASTFGNDLVGKYGEYSANPSSRQFGFNVKVKF